MCCSVSIENLLDGLENIAEKAVTASAQWKPIRSIAFHPVIVSGGYHIATRAALFWGRPWARIRFHTPENLVVLAGLPSWVFGRGGTTIGGVYLTRSLLTEEVLRHETVHMKQWRKYGLVFPLLYMAAGRNPLTNRFEQEAGLADGGYLQPDILRSLWHDPVFR